MSYCLTHGTFDDYFSRGCPTCRDIEDRAQLDREEMRNALSDIAHGSANLGDYVCPYCKQTSLKSGASRCPLCRGEIRDHYWEVIIAREKAEDETRQAAAIAAADQKRAAEAAAAAEYLRSAPQRAAEAERDARAAERAARVERLKRFGEFLLATIAGAIVGMVAGFVIGIVVFAIGWAAFRGDSTRASALAHSVGYIVMAIGAVWGAVLGWVRPWGPSQD